MDCERDARILAMWDAGKNATEIAAATGLNEVRVYHELNKLLNERAGHHGRAKTLQRSEVE